MVNMVDIYHTRTTAPKRHGRRSQKVSTPYRQLFHAISSDVKYLIFDEISWDSPAALSRSTTPSTDLFKLI